MRFGKIIKSDENYILLKTKGDNGLVELELRCRLENHDGTIAEFCAGTAEQDESGHWTVLCAEHCNGEFDIKELGKFFNINNAADALWSRRLWFHWNYLH